MLAGLLGLAGCSTHQPVSLYQLDSGSPAQPAQAAGMAVLLGPVVVADYLQRAAGHIASKTDVEQAYALGRKAVELALDGQNAVMPTIDRICDEPYAYKLGVASLADVANQEKFMPRDFISDDGFGITPECVAYLKPLIQGEDYPAYRDGLPDYVTLKNQAVAPKLAAFELK